MELLFDQDVKSRTVQIFHWLDDEDKFVIEDRQEISALLEQNKALRNSDHQHDRKSGMRRTASIPMNLYYKLREEMDAKGMDWAERQAFLKRWLNDPDNKLFRTDNTKV